MALSTEDQLEIQQLYAKYNHSLDFGDVDGWVGTFTSGGTFNGPGGPFTGPEALGAFATGFGQQMGGKLRHWNTNLLVEATDGGAKGSCYLMALVNADEGVQVVSAASRYMDELSKEGGSWKFQSRSIE